MRRKNIVCRQNFSGNHSFHKGPVWKLFLLQICFNGIPLIKDPVWNHFKRGQNLRFQTGRCDPYCMYSHSCALIYTSIYRHALKDTAHIRHLGIFWGEKKLLSDERQGFSCNWNLAKVENIKVLKLEEWCPCVPAFPLSWMWFWIFF